MPKASVANRRPIKSRQWRTFRSLAARLAASGITPNAISLSSIVFGVVAGLAFAATSWIEQDFVRRATWLAAAACIQLRLIANLLDGMVAVEGGKGTVTGDLYNEAPDRVADVAIVLGAGYSASGDPMLGALAAIVVVFVAYVRALGASLGVGQVFLGPMAKQQRMALMTVVALFCAATPIDWHLERPASWGAVSAALLVIIVGGLATAARRLARIASLLKAYREQ